jgi:hypothetical protein
VATPDQIRRRGRWSLILGTLLAALTVGAVMAYADNLKNDVTAGGNDTFTAGGSTTIDYWIQAIGSCDAADGSSATVAINVPAGVAATPSSLVFTACNTSSEGSPTNTKSVVFSSSTPGTYGVTASVTDSTGSYNTSPAAFTIHVLAAPVTNTPPSVSVTGVVDGASYDIGSVPSAGCSVTDAEDGNSSFAATLSPISGPYAADGIGNQTASCSYTDAGGLTDSDSATYAIVDPSAPSIGYVLNPATPDGTNGWYVGDVTLTWAVTEDESPSSLVTNGCVDQSVTADQGATTYSCSATSAGGSAGPVDVTVKRDATKPTISGSASPAANGNGWNNTDVTVSFTCNDNLSGVASCGPNTTLSAEGSGQSVTGTAVDDAGNSDSATVSGINIDKINPDVSLVGGPADGASYFFGSVPTAPTCSASDGLSGIDGSCSVSGYGTTVGTHTVTAGAADKAGNSSSESHTYTVLAWTLTGFYQPVDMGGVFNSVKAGATVPLKFEIFAGSTELTEVADVASLKYGAVACDATAPSDDIETTATGGTSLRYDTTAGQFVYNWKSPATKGCYSLTMKTLDGSLLSAYFKLK